MKTRTLLVSGVLALLVALMPSTAAQDTAAWTMMVYMEADNNLEGDALADILEMELAGSSDEVNLIVQIDRADDYDIGDGDWTGARRYLITRNDNLSTIEDIVIQKVTNPESITLSSEILADLGEINNGDPQTLIDFVLWAVENYPAENYGLIMWNHGGTWVGGFGGDESTEDHDGINLPELDAALSLITEEIGQNFEFIGFDTCLMGQMEVFSILANYANYAAGAEELEPGFGWYYTPVFDMLTRNPAADGAAVAEQVVISYMSFYDDVMPSLAGEPFWMNYDQTAVDLSQYTALEAALSNFSQAAQANMDDIIDAIGTARNNTQIFGGATPDETDPLSAVDLIHFMELLMKLSDNAPVNQAAGEVIAAAENFILVSHANPGLPGARGLSIFFPRNPRIYALDNNSSRYPVEVSQMTTWQAFLDAFYGTATTVVDVAAGSITIQNVFVPADVVNVLNPPTILFETNGQNITSVSFGAILDLGDGTQLMLDQDTLESVTFTEDGDSIVDYPDGVSQSQFTWGAEMPVISDGTVSIPTLLIDNGIEDQVAVSGLYGFSTGQTLDAFLTLSLETREVLNVWGINESENGGQPFEIAPVVGDEFLPTWRFIDENGETQLIPSSDVLTFSTQPFTFEFMPAPSGSYTFVILMEDIAGNIYLDSTLIEVDSEGLSADLRGFNDVSYGYSIWYPWEWDEPIDIELDEGGTQTVLENLDGSVTAVFNFYDANSLSDMLDITHDYLDDMVAEYTEPEPDEIGGYESYYTEYERELEDGTLVSGVVLSVYVPENELGYLIDVSALAEAEDEGLAYLDTLHESLLFFEPIE